MTNRKMDGTDMNAPAADDLAAELRAALIEVDDQLPATDAENVTELIDAGEFGVALETLCTQLYEVDAVVSERTFQRLESIGSSMGMSAKTWAMLKPADDEGTDGAEAAESGAAASASSGEN